LDFSRSRRNEILRRWKSGRLCMRSARCLTSPHSSIRCLFFASCRDFLLKRARCPASLTRAEREDISRRDCFRLVDAPRSPYPGYEAGFDVAVSHPPWGLPSIGPHEADDQSWESALRRRVPSCPAPDVCESWFTSKLILDWSPKHSGLAGRLSIPKDEGIACSPRPFTVACYPSACVLKKSCWTTCYASGACAVRSQALSYLQGFARSNPQMPSRSGNYPRKLPTARSLVIGRAIS